MERTYPQKKTEKSQQIDEASSNLSDEEIEDNGSSEEEQRKTLQKLRPRLPRTFDEKETWPRVFVILEAA